MTISSKTAKLISSRIYPSQEDIDQAVEYLLNRGFVYSGASEGTNRVVITHPRTGQVGKTGKTMLYSEVRFRDPITRKSLGLSKSLKAAVAYDKGFAQVRAIVVNAIKHMTSGEYEKSETYLRSLLTMLGGSINES